MFGQSLLSAFGSAACTTDTNQLFGTDVQTTSVATYQLNNATTSIPSNTYPGTPSNITYAAGKFGNAAVFNGSSSKIDISATNSTPVDFSSKNFTISAWINGSGFTTDDRTIISKYSGSNNTTSSFFFDVRDNDQKLRVTEINGTSALGLQSAAAIPENTWTHVVYVRTATTCEFFINGVSSGGSQSRTTPINQGGTTDISIGERQANKRWIGKIDQVRIFNSALPQSAITALYNETTTTATYPYVDYVNANPNSVAYYKMSDATDQLGNYNGTATNVNFNTEGKFGFAGAFNGSSSQIELPSNPIGTNLIGSISLWLKGASFGNSAASTDIAFYNRNPYVLIDTYQNNLRVIIKNSSSSNTTISYALSNFNTSDWYNIAVVLTGVSSTFTLYVNGSSVGTATAPSTTRNVGSTALIGLNSATWDGSIDQIRIYDSALSAANVTKLYNEIECPAVAVTNAFNTVLYTGNGGTQSITSLNFEPDLIWIKERSGSEWHNLFDSVRGSNKSLYSNETSSEATSSNKLTSFDTNGFSLGTDNNVNKASSTFVAWNWKAGGAAVSNTDGTITSQVSANVDAGFSIVKYTGSSPNQTVGHGLDATPEFIVVKNMDTTGNGWATQSPFSGGADYHMMLNLTQEAKNNVDWIWNDTEPTSTVFSIGQNGITNTSGNNYIAYCWHSIPGYSKVGSYVGTGATGNVQYVGFEPSFVMIKSTGIESWYMMDNKRLNGVYSDQLYANLSNSEGTGQHVDFTSSGFQLDTTDGGVNSGSASYIFIAIA